jgi:hypothetical protein
VDLLAAEQDYAGGEVDLHIAVSLMANALLPPGPKRQSTAAWIFPRQLLISRVSLTITTLKIAMLFACVGWAD